MHLAKATVRLGHVGSDAEEALAQKAPRTDGRATPAGWGRARGGSRRDGRVQTGDEGTSLRSSRSATARAASGLMAVPTGGSEVRLQ